MKQVTAHTKVIEVKKLNHVLMGLYYYLKQHAAYTKVIKVKITVKKLNHVLMGLPYVSLLSQTAVKIAQCMVVSHSVTFK